MSYGLLAGLFWGLDTVILGIALIMTPFVSTSQAVFLAPFISTFLHDICSSFWMLLYMGMRREYKSVLRAVRTRSGKFVILAALLGGPVGMTGYVFSIKYIGAAYTAVISALFPGVGALLAYLILKEKMTISQLIALAVSIIGVIGLGYTPESNEVTNLFAGFLFALMCVFGWASEAVIIAYGLKDPDISDRDALQIRQVTSAVFYAIILIPIVRGWGSVLAVSQTTTVPVILSAAFFGTVSYLFYYKAIATIGPSKAMALNITYSAWAIFFGFLLLNERIGLPSIFFALLIVGGSVVAASDQPFFFKRKTNE